MDFNALWSRASAAALEVATAAQEQASRAAAAAQEQAELLQGSETFATLEKALVDIAANTVAVAEQSERNFQAMLADEADKSRARALAASAPKAFGVDEDLDAFLQGLTKETFAAFPLDDAAFASAGAPAAGSKDRPTEPEAEGTSKRSTFVSPWRETHARLALAHVPKLRNLRDDLVPDLMDDDSFWRAYFTLCAPQLAKVEARAAAAVARSRARGAAMAAEQAEPSPENDTRFESGKDGEPDVASAVARRAPGGDAAEAGTRTAAAADAGAAAAALAAAFRDDDDSPGDAGRSGSSGSACEDEDGDAPPSAPSGGDLDAYLNDLLGGSSDEDDEDDKDAAPDPPPADLSSSEKTHTSSANE